MTKNNNVVSKVLMIVISAFLALILYVVKTTNSEVDNMRTDIQQLKTDVAVIVTRLDNQNRAKVSYENDRLGKILKGRTRSEN